LNRDRIARDQRSNPPAREKNGVGLTPVSETGGQVTAWEGEKNPARPKGQ